MSFTEGLIFLETERKKRTGRFMYCLADLENRYKKVIRYIFGGAYQALNEL